ncbi:MAG TPA: DUF502 domain-containing protein [Rhabdochlamydiaceae bacterium]|jgi:uncharacterized membrane protein
MKKYFFTGFITLLPIALTIIIVKWLFDLFTAPLAGISEWFLLKYEAELGLSLTHHDTLIMLLSRVLAFVLLVLLIFLLGFCGQKFLTKYFLNITNRIFSRIPLVRTIYRLSHDITKAVFSDTQKTFKGTVLIPFPHQDSLAIGFITGETPAIIKQASPLTEIAIFVPTAPHPMSGFLLLSPRNVALSIDVSVEDAFKYLISAGVLHPGEKVPSSVQK